MSNSTLVDGAPGFALPALSPRRLLGLARSHAAVVTVGTAMLLIAGDFETGIEIAFTLLYLAPIAAAAWWRGRALGLAVAALCVSGAIGTEIVWRLERGWSLPVVRMAWNYGGSLVLFGLGVLLIVRLREYADKEARERRAAVEQLRQAERLGVVGKLAAGLAHEIGTPLNVIMGHAELLASERLTRPMLSAASSTILAQTNKMTMIVQGLLDFSRRSGGGKVAVDLVALAQSAAALLLPVAHKKQIDIAVDASNARGAIVHGNRTELEQVLVNIMMNGIQAMTAGGRLYVRVRGSRVSDEEEYGSDRPPPSACVEIEDEGGGIATENLPQIFDPFFTTKKVGEGTGLGLSVSYGIVSDHGGQIRVATTLGAGSRFFVCLPLAPASA